ncbi:DMT family transporter [Paradesulfitobacterium ferrireducens]|uniref:DMT family transporter n=1 Tax=Paradesulfitobacterium ferrireducens TaxID=2816476 RepID=UPI001A8D9148|nr:DMT family transporter [Paradesulfitobacterium ferrireducens]
MQANRRYLADLSLIGVTLVWGATFVVVKRAITDLPPFPFLAIRFGLAFLSLLPFVWLQRRHLNKRTVFQGLALGIFLFAGYAWQTIGLQYTTASNAGFITGMSVVLVPALVTVSTKSLPRPGMMLGIASAAIGLALLSLGEGYVLNRGDAMVLLCAFSFALHIFLVGRYAPEGNATVLAAVQILAVSILSAGASFILPQPPLIFSGSAWFGLLLTAIPATSLAFFLQTKMQQFTTPTHTAIIFSSEPVFSAVFAYFLAGEVLSDRGLLGAALVLSGMLLAELTGTESGARLSEKQGKSRLRLASKRER